MNKEKNCDYTIMLVSHARQRVKQLHISPFLLKGGCFFAVSFLLVAIALFYHYNSTMQQAMSDKEELRRLREVNTVQIAQIQQLAQTTMTLQQDMQRINKLDEELRTIAGMETNQTAPISRNTIVRPANYLANGPQGGPGRGPDVQQLARSLEQLRLEMTAREASLVMLRDSIAAKQARQAATPTIWPASGDITSGFGYRSSPWGWGREFHPGIDIADSWGTPIFATADGTVVFADWDGGYGKIVLIDHGNGIQTAYAHTATMLVTVGQKVSKGQHIADIGSTGASTGPHVHYEVRIGGERVNPLDYVQ